MISTSIAVRRRLALLAQQQPSSEDNRQQQQQGSTDFQWAQTGGVRIPSHRLPARAPVIGTADDRRHDSVPALPRRGAVVRPPEAAPRRDTATQQA